MPGSSAGSLPEWQKPRRERFADDAELWMEPGEHDRATGGAITDALCRRLSTRAAVHAR